MADQNFRVKRGLEVGVGKTILYADPGGNVGIGTDIPTDVLDIQTGTSDEVTTFKVKTGGQIELSRNHARKPRLDTSMPSGRPTLTLSNAEDFGTVTEKVKLNTAGDSFLIGGNLGIGSTLPTVKLDVDGNILSGFHGIDINNEGNGVSNEAFAVTSAPGDSVYTRKTTLYTDGSASFAGGNGSDTNQSFGIDQFGRVSIREDASTPADVFSIYKGSSSTKTVSISNDGSATFAGPITGNTDTSYLPIGTVTDSLFLRGNNVVFTSQDGSDHYGHFDTAGAFRIGGDSTSNNAIINADGSADFTSSVTATRFIADNANNTADGGGQIYLSGATGNRIDFNQNGVAAPAFTTRSAGTKLVLYPAISGTQVDYGLGIESSTLWYSVPTTSETHRWYGGTTEMMSLTNSNLTVGDSLTVGNNAGINTATIAGPANLIIDPAVVGDNTGLVRIKGDLYVDGTTTQINSTTLEIADFVVGIASTAPTDLLTDGAGIGIGSLSPGGSHYHTFLYEFDGGTNPSLKSSENLNVASGKVYQIDQTERLSADTLSLGTGTTIFSPASNTLSFGTNGSPRATIDSSGRLLVGTTSALTTGDSLKLHLLDTAGAKIALGRNDTTTTTDNTIGDITFYGNDSNGTYEGCARIRCQADAAHGTGNKPSRLIFSTTADSASSPTERLRIQSDGNVNIGRNGSHTDSTSRLSVHNSGLSETWSVRPGSNVSNQIDFISYNYNTSTYLPTRSIAGEWIWFDGDNGERMRITSGGLVGIGTDNPTQKLDIIGGNVRVGKTSNGKYIAENSSGESKVVIGSSGTSYLNGGNIGIGTTLPLGPLDVRGNIYSLATDNTSNRSIYFGNSDFLTSFRYMAVGWHNGNLAAEYYTQGAYPHVFYTNNSEALRIDSSGRLLVGTDTARTSYFNGVAGAAFQSEGTTVNNSGISVTLNATDDVSGSGLILARSRGSGIGSHTLVGNNAPLGAVYFQGADGTDFVEGARIQAFVDGTPGENDMPTRLVFSVTADDESTPTERMRITSGGNVGIETNNPARPLDVQGAAQVVNGGGTAFLVGRERDLNTYISLGSVSDNEVKLQAGSGGTRNVDLSFYTSDGGTESEQARIDSSGRLLVGTTIFGGEASSVIQGSSAGATTQAQLWLNRGEIDPAVDLALGQIIFGDATSTGSNGAMIQARTDGSWGEVNGNPTRLAFFTEDVGSDDGPSERMRITSGGLVGIGTDNPTVPLEVAGTTGTASTIFINAPTHNSSVVSEAVLKFGYAHSGSPNAVAEIKLVEGSTNSFGGNLTFSVPSNNGSGGSSTSEALRITSDGNLGIGITNPDVLLTANTTIADAYTNGTAALNVPNGEILKIRNLDNTTDNTGAFASFHARGATSTMSIWYAGNTGGDSTGFNGDFVIGNRTGDPQYTERIRIDSAGRLLVGTTSYAESTTAAFQGGYGNVGNPGRIALLRQYSIISGNNVDAEVARIIFADDNGDGDGAQIRAEIDGTSWSTTSKPTRFTFHTSASGSASPTERMRITSGGSVGIGTDNPGFKLEVNGSFAATTKSFIIPHPTKENKRLRYASLEGPENGVYVRGRSQDTVIDLPDYWTGLVDENSITVNLTPIGYSATPRVMNVENNQVNVFSKEEGDLDYYYIIYGERKDVQKLEVEI